MSNFDWRWSPGIGVGPCKFGESIQLVAQGIDIKKVRDEGTSSTGWGVYEVVGDEYKTVWSENGTVVCVRCEDVFVFMNKNLIGMSEEELIAHMGQQPDEIGTSVEFEDGSVQTPFEYEDLGLEVWFEGGKLVSASATEIVDD